MGKESYLSLRKCYSIQTLSNSGHAIHQVSCKNKVTALEPQTLRTKNISILKG